MNLRLRNIVFLFILILTSLVKHAFAQTLGKASFDTHCASCHHLAEPTVGPSVSEIKALYPTSKQWQFLLWTKQPGKKREGSAQMPAMGYLGDAVLTDIHHYIANVNLSKNTKSRQSKYAFKPAPKTYPYYKRAYMPFSSPAAIGIMFSPKLGLSWDTSTCKLSYVFLSNKNFFRGERDQQKLLSDITFRNTSSGNGLLSSNEAIIFKGYRLRNALPEFICQTQGITINERISASKSGNGIIRSFKLTGVKEDIVLDLSHDGHVSIVASEGNLIDDKLYLSPEQSKRFDISIEAKL